MRRDARRWPFVVATVGLVVVAGELLAAALLRIVLPSSAPELVYLPRVEALVARHDEYLRLRDPDLGWPFSRAYGAECCDESGARRNPAFPVVGTACVSAYGDSFTWADEVAAEDAWATQLSRRLGC